MGIPGRLIGPLESTLGKEKKWWWGESSLFKLRRTLGEPKQLASKHMIQMEEVGGTALPSATSTHGAQKYAQLGQDCATQIITSAVASWLNLSIFLNGKQLHDNNCCLELV